MLKVLEKSQSFLSKFLKVYQVPLSDLFSKLEKELEGFNFSWVLVDKFGFERNAINWLKFSPALLKYLVNKVFFGKYDKGKEAEIRSAKHLSSLGFGIVLMNYRSVNGEIDIVVFGSGVIRFVEVKSSYTSVVEPEERIDRVKINKILAVSEDFFVDLGSDFDSCYDVVVVGREGIFYLPDYLL